MYKIVGIAGSPRKNQTTDELVQYALSSAKRRVPEIETEFISLAGRKFNGCLACDKCKENFGCVQKDDLTDV